MKSMVMVIVALGMLTQTVNQSAKTRAASPIAFVSVLRILNESNDGKANAAKVESVRRAKAQEINEKRQALDKTRDQLANAGGIFSDAKRAKLQVQERQQQADLQRVTQQAQAAIQEFQGQLQTDLRRKLNGVIAEIANRRAIQVVLNKETGVVWAPEGADLTSEVLERLNAVATAK